MTEKTTTSTSIPECTDRVPSEDATITAEHIQQLIDTNQALRESVICITALLQEQKVSNIIYPQRNDSGVDATSWTQRSKESQDGLLQQSAPRIRSDRDSRKRRYEEQWQEIVPMSEEAIESERATRREAYENHWPPVPLKVHFEKPTDLCPTLLPYDDPWWDIVSCPLREVSMVDQPQSRKLDTALRSGLRYELFIALFGSEFNYKWLNTSKNTFEESRRFRLGQIIHKLQDTGAIAYFGASFARVLVEVAEWTKTVWTRRPEGSQTLEGLRHHCYQRQVLTHPPSFDFRTVEQQNEGLLAILYALDLRKWWNIGGSWQRVVSELDMDELPLEALISNVDQVTGWTGKMGSRTHNLEPSKNMSVDPKDLNSRAIRDLGDIHITWTPELDMHLRLSLDGKRLYVYQYPTWLIGRRFNNPRSLYINAGDDADSNKIFHDLAETYALLFGPSSAKEATHLLKVLQDTECNAHLLGVPLWRSDSGSSTSLVVKVQLDPELAPTRYFLDNFRSVDLPYSVEPPEGPSSKKYTMADVIRGGQPYHDDMAIMMLSIVRFYPLSGSFNWSGSHFEEQLRMLKAYMDGKKPRTIGQLWRDARDATSWWTFWAVLFFGIASIVLALGALIVSIIQTVGTFKGLE